MFWGEKLPFFSISKCQNPQKISGYLLGYPAQKKKREVSMCVKLLTTSHPLGYSSSLLIELRLSNNL